MIVITGVIPIDGSKRDQVVQIVNTMRAATLLEDGCAQYRFSFATDEPNTLLIIEEWRDQKALTLHFGTPHMAAMQAEMPNIVVGAPVLTRYVVESKGSL